MWKSSPQLVGIALSCALVGSLVALLDVEGSTASRTTYPSLTRQAIAVATYAPSAVPTANLNPVIPPTPGGVPGTPVCAGLPPADAAACAGTGASAYAPGIDGIHPVSRFVDAGTPTFTETDVRAYLAANPWRTTNGTPGTITKILFFPAGQLRSIIPYATNVRPDDEVLCLVEMSGPFAFEPGDAPGGFLVFDALTGNLLAQGGL